MMKAVVALILVILVVVSNAEIHAPLQRMRRQIYEPLGLGGGLGYPRQTITTYGNTHNSVSSVSTGGVLGSPVVGSPIVGTPIQVSTIGEPLGVSTYGTGIDPYTGSVVGPYGTLGGGNIVKKTVVTETFVNRG